MFLKRNKKYSISPDEDWVTPEETLLDSSSQFSDIEKPIPSSIFRFFLITFLILFCVLIMFTFKISVLENKEFAQLAFQNKSANFPLKPPRGLILDRNGKTLTNNLPIFNLLAVTRELNENIDLLDGSIADLANIIGGDQEILRKYVLEQMQQNSTFFAHLDLAKEEALKIEHLGPVGFYVVPDTKREYISGNKLSQIVGYTGKVNRRDLEDNYYFTTDVIGRQGIEYQYEKFLRGDHGNIFFSREETGYITRNSIAGDNIILNIDYDMQIKLYDEIFTILRDEGLSQASGIIQNPNTGEVLAMVSFPSFDNNIFTTGVSESDYRKLFENPLKPLFNRVIGGLYNPGSTIKPFIGMTALEENIITSDFTVKDCISITIQNPYSPDISYIYRNWRNEYGLFNLRKSIANSCNIFFYTIGGGYDNIQGLGIERIANYLTRAYANKSLGIDIPGETEGFVPTPEWKLRETGEQWYLGDTYNISIGQGDLLITPLWLNSYVAAIANGGQIFKPQIAKRVIDKDNSELKSFVPEATVKLPFSKDTIQEVRRDMMETVESGTAQILKALPVSAGAKTGTAEVLKGRITNSFFTVFAPYDNPEIVMTVLIEGTSSQQGLAVRAAHQVLQWYFDQK